MSLPIPQALPPINKSGVGDGLPQIVTPIPGPRSFAMAERLKQVESPDTTFFSPDFPVFWDSARGCNVWDVDGNRYLDLTSAFGVAAVGHSHPVIVEAIRAQADRLIHGMGDVHPNEVKLRLAEEIVRHAPAGHEWTATASEKFTAGIEGLVPNRPMVFPFPQASRDAGVIGAIESFLASERGIRAQIGAMIIEPIQGRGGIRIASGEFLRALRRICDAHGILLIFDEVYSGFGRTGSWFAGPAMGIVPDLIAAGKSLGGGMPISGCIGKREIIEQWGISQGEARHTSTFLGHPLSCAAALAAVSVLEMDGLLDDSVRKAKQFCDLLNGKIQKNPRIREVQGLGLMIGVELAAPGNGRSAAALTWDVVVAGLKRGLILLPCGLEGNVLSITPPLTITGPQLDFAAETLAEILDQAGH
ncbi:aminotransferase class III-fold pyridoxal phosphate-dependent enzyme [Candidatus Sumerlaeota bacterium]|nr:aminotransferase class III-fold pyridoxal phosphate-dependent enzyme [Candidatus Sumerlaeota bacterium]